MCNVFTSIAITRCRAGSHEAVLGYTEDNTRLICHDCDRKIQENRGFR